MSALVLAPFPNRTYIVSSGDSYTSDINGLIYNVSQPQDVIDLQSRGCIVLNPPPGNLVGKLLQANFNSTSDQLFTMTINSKFRVTKITVENASVSLTTAEGGIYTAAGKSGTIIVAATQTYTTAGATTAQDLTLANPNTVLPGAPTNTLLYFSLTTAQGVTATADIFAYGDLYPAS